MKKKVKKSGNKRVAKTRNAKTKHGNVKYQDPVDKSIRLERAQWEEIESFCPPSAVAFMSWNDKMQILLGLARISYNARRERTALLGH